MFNDNCIELQTNGDSSKNISLAGYLDEIYSYLKNLINVLKKSIDAWKTNLSTKSIFRSSNDNDEERKMFLRSENVLARIVGSTKETSMSFLDP